MQHWYQQAIKTLDDNSRDAALARQSQLTKPPGALGKLEQIAVQLAAMQSKTIPSVDNIDIIVFAGDHGIAAQGVSAFPQAVTVEMIKNFSRGGAAINVLARQLGACFRVVNMGTVLPTDNLSQVENRAVGTGTRDFSVETAMTESELLQALETGATLIDELSACELFIAGEMGIANTSSATALAAVLLDKKASDLAGPGTGLTTEAVSNKAAIIQTAIDKHAVDTNNPLLVLQTFGGFEIAAIVGSYIRCAQRGIPVLVDGFITSAAALVASKLAPGCQQWFLYSHASAEPGHQLIIQALSAEPLLDLSMRLGEGSGAAVAAPLIRSACRLHAEMATFADAGVSEKSS